MTNNQVAIVTGSATGVGAATCEILASKGWNVVINYSRSEKEAVKTVEKCRKFGTEVLICEANVANDDDCRRLVEMAYDTWGRLDALVNNAGRTKFCDYSDLDGLLKQDFLDLYEVNVIGAYQMARAAKPYLKNAQDGVIVNTSSISAVSGVGSSIAYAASKGALSTLTRALAHAVAPDIRVNAVCPGFIQGRWTKNFLGDRYGEVSKIFEDSSLLKKTCLPVDVARSIVYLINEAKMTTGELLILDGGQLLNQSL